MWPDIPFDRTPAQSFVKSRTLRPRAQIGAGNVQREAIQCCAVDQRAADAAPARMRLHPHRRDPWRELRPLRRSEAITEAVPRNDLPSCATSANGIGVAFMFSRRRPEI